MKPLAFAFALLCALTATALSQTRVTTSDRYRNMMAAHLTADERIATYEKLLKDSPNDAKVGAELADAFLQSRRETLLDKILASDLQSYDGIRIGAEIEAHRHNFPKPAQLDSLLTDRNHARIIANTGGHGERRRELLQQARALNPTFSYAAAQDASHLEDAGNRATNPQIVLH